MLQFIITLMIIIILILDSLSVKLFIVRIILYTFLQQKIMHNIVKDKSKIETSIMLRNKSLNYAMKDKHHCII